MNVRRILLEPMIINKVGRPEEREARIREVLEEVRLVPVEDFLPKFPPHAFRRPAAEARDRPRLGFAAQTHRGR